MSQRTCLRTALAATLVFGFLLGAGAPQAQAAGGGTAVLSVELTPVNPTTGDTVTEFAAGLYNNRLGYRVSYSCAVAACENTTIALTPTALDPTYGTQRMFTYDTWTAPTGATISGSDAAGRTVSLGTLAAGTSGTFTIVYRQNGDIGYTLTGGSSYFPDGFQIEQSATIDSDTAAVTATASADPVTWSIEIPEPAITKSNPGTVAPGVNVSYTLRMNSGCFSGGSGRIYTSGAYLCAKGYTVVDQLPVQAEFVSAGGGGVYDPVAHTITWTASGTGHSGGWGSTAATWTTRGNYSPRTVVLRYPAESFPEAAGGADFSVPVTNQITTTVTYLDEAETVKTATASVTHDVVRVTPFGRATAGKDSTSDASSGATRYVNIVPDVTGMVCPDEGSDTWGRTCTPGSALATFTDTEYWYVDTYNRANVPGVAVVTDTSLDNPDAPVTRITTNTVAASIAYTLNTGATGTVTNTQTYTAPAGTRIVAATVTSGTLAGPNQTQQQNNGTLFRVTYTYTVTSTATAGAQWVNNATSVMTYPDYDDLADIALTSTRTVVFRDYPAAAAATPRFSASVVSAVVDGGGQAVPGRNVTFTVRGATSNIPLGDDISPQYVFIAPSGWTVQSGSAAFAAGTVPDGVLFNYRTVTIGGVERQAVIASWPDGAVFGENVTWPSMTVVATPTYAVTAGTSSVATFWAGDSLHTYDTITATWAAVVTDTTDVDGDGSTTEPFASATASVTVSAFDLLGVVKEICVPDAGAADGCDWASDPDIVVGVAPTASNITYRITLQNTGNTTLASVVAYDVLPYVGDYGTSSSTASTPRGSTFNESLNAITNQSSNVTLTFSPSTDPRRPEVNTSTSGYPDDWGTTAADAQAIRATVAGSLAPGATATFTYTANVVSGATADALACNSVAVDSDRTLPAEPEAVCATTQEADLAISLPDRLPLQVGRPGVLPYTVTNLGGSAAAPATVTVTIPEGVWVTSLEPDGWTCTASEVETDGSVVGPVELECAATNGDGSARALALDTPDALNIPALVPDASLAGTTTCFPAVVSGLMSDPDLTNNNTSACFAVASADALFTIAKTDNRAAVGIGDQYTYQVTVTNGLVGESVTDVTVTDTLPDGVVFVSASAGGQISGQGAEDAYGNAPGGTVTWNIAELAAAGVAGAGGDQETGAAGSTAVLTVTVRVVPGATGDVVNRVEATAVDPFRSQNTLDAQDTDTDGLYVLELTKTSDAATSGVRIGDTVTYTVTARNTGTAAFPSATIVDDLTGVLDDAEFVTGSAAVQVNGGTAVPVPDPVDDEIAWTGQIPIGRTAVLSYQVIVVDPGDGSIVNRAATQTGSTGCDTGTGVDADGLACAANAVTFAPTVVKSVDSLTQANDGTWMIVYGVDVTNPGDATAGYDLSDDLRFGTGIDVLDAEVTDAPDDVTVLGWAGNGEVVSAAALEAGETHHYELTVSADAHALAGTGPAFCADGAPGGFANGATAELSDGATRTADACAEPVEPTVAKALDGDPVQGDDGDWTVAWLVTVTNPYATPAGGLAYTLADEFAFPAGVSVRSVTVTAPDGVTANPGFTGGLDKLDGTTVTADGNLVDGVARIPAATASGAAVQQYRVEVVASAPSTAVDSGLVACGVDGSGYGNWVTLLSGTTEIGRATACADIALPRLQFTKTASAPDGTAPGDVIHYTITATNTGAAGFSAADPAVVVDDMTELLDDTTYAGDVRATLGAVAVNQTGLTWSGPLAAGETVTLSYTAVIGETGSGDGKLVNIARLLSAAMPSGEVPACAADVAGNAGVPVCTVTLQAVADAEDGGDTGGGTDPGDGTGGNADPDDLAWTGSSPTPLIAAAVLLTVIGTGLVAARGRHQRVTRNRANG